MPTFDDVTEKAKDFFQTASKKTGAFVETQKLRVNATDLRGKINKLYRELGELVYNADKEEIDVTDAVNDLVRQIDGKLEELNSIKSQIDEKSNKRTCPVCGKGNPDDAAFCSNCGEKIKYSYSSSDVEVEPAAEIKAEEVETEVEVEAEISNEETDEN